MSWGHMVSPILHYFFFIYFFHYNHVILQMISLQMKFSEIVNK